MEKTVALNTAPYLTKKKKSLCTNVLTMFVTFHTKMDGFLRWYAHTILAKVSCGIKNKNKVNKGWDIDEATRRITYGNWW